MSNTCPCGSDNKLPDYQHDRDVPGCVAGHNPILPTGPILIAGHVNWDHRFCSHAPTTTARTTCRAEHGITAVMPG